MIHQQIHKAICKCILRYDADDVSGWVSILDLAEQMHDLKSDGELTLNYAYNTSPTILQDEVISINSSSIDDEQDD